MTKLEFLDWLFIRPVAEKNWFFTGSMDIPISTTEASKILQKVDPEKDIFQNYESKIILQGIEALTLSGGICSSIIQSKNVPVKRKKEIFSFMQSTFLCLPGTKDYDNLKFMWWDSICMIIGDSELYSENSIESEKERKELLEHLVDILQIQLLDKDKYSKLSAVHGLGHLGDEKSKVLLEGELNQENSISAEYREYIESAIKGDIL